MNPISDDPIARNLAELPPIPLDPAAADAVRRRARIAFIEGEGALPGWPAALLQGVLLASGAVYTCFSLIMIARIFGGA